MGSLLTDVLQRLQELAVAAEIKDDVLVVEGGERTMRLRVDEELERDYDVLQRAGLKSMDLTTRVFALDNVLEFPLVRLDPFTWRQTPYEFLDADGSSVAIGRVSNAYGLAHLFCNLYPRYFERVVRPRLERGSIRRVNDLLFTSTTAMYRAGTQGPAPDAVQHAEARVRACLFKLAVEQNECLVIWEPREGRAGLMQPRVGEMSSEMPRCRYEENAVNFYKVAKSSPFPSQSFLAYYNVMEYYFLRVAEDTLHHRLRTALQDTSFRADARGLDRVISLVRGEDARADETEMLRKVLEKFVAEGEVIAFVTELEARCGEKIYSRRRVIFGESVEISLREGHALANAAKAIKHMRNAIVHSSDRYTREECHVPLSESENTVAEFIPLVRFFAERVIYGTAT